jgi:trk system potassium uptake protein TrkA
MAVTLAELGQDVIGVDGEEERVRQVADVLAQATQLDATDERALKEAGIQDVDVAIVSIGEDIESSLLVVMQLKELGIQTIVAKAVTPLHGRILEKIGVSRVIFPEREVAIRTAHSLVVPNALDYIELSKDYSIVEIAAPASFVGRTLKELELRPRFGLTLVAVKRAGPGGTVVTNISPAAEESILAGDTLALLGSNESIAKMNQQLEQQK